MSAMKRREFAKRAAAAAMVAPMAWTGMAQQEMPKAEPKLKLTPKLEEDVKKATERREQQLAGLRQRALPYDLEPAFVFAARPKGRRKN